MRKAALSAEQVDSIDTFALIIVDDGVIVDQWGETTRNINVHSIRKSLLSALYGNAVAKGDVNINATLEQLGISDTRQA